ncbi:MAG: pseudouridylate synthase [Saprospiraceae bacterium]|nr:pseudouridylate synthase [Saprospiraceae bacterium]
MFTILYEDENIIIIDKPNGYFVHKSSYDAKSEWIVLQLLRDQIGQRVYPVHRLDRKTSGILVMAKSMDAHRFYSQKFMNKEVVKKYVAIVRGYTPDSFEVNTPLDTERGDSQDALTLCKTICRSEIQKSSSDKFVTSRYSLIEAQPVTGRQHQIRRHLSHLRYPIIGDRPYGCSKQNRFFLSEWNMTRMFLHAWQITLPMLEGNEKIMVSHLPGDDFLFILEKLSLHKCER